MSGTAISSDDVIVVGNSSDDPFAIDVAFGVGQVEDVADLISLKTFANSEFCPRFISDERDFSRIGRKLEGRTVVVVSTSSRLVSRQNLAMRTLMIARAAKENGARDVVLVEPDLYYSAQDRGPRVEGQDQAGRDVADLKKFDGQPFTARLYGQMLKLAGVDAVLTVHNHSHAVQTMFHEIFDGRFHNVMPYEIYVDYLRNSNLVRYGADGEGLALCAPDQGARDFVKSLYRHLGLTRAKVILLDKQRSGERDVEIALHPDSETTFEEIHGHDVVLLDDMVRTGSTVVKTCEFLKQIEPGRLVFAVTHFYASEEGRQKLASTAVDEILTLNTLPTILNRDEQGRLRRKLVVLKIESWLARELCAILGLPPRTGGSLYQIDMSSKNPRFVRKIWSNEQLPELHAGPHGADDRPGQ